jgi:hypothetical protein
MTTLPVLTTRGPMTWRAWWRIVGVSPAHWRQGRRRDGPALAVVEAPPEPTEG